ncbi:MAG: BlaI/MecI/CopY family transcriptional regulator [Candidatus Latescibacteria bacterium]|jgi:BlaI family transcriptional regulator, penicillinase repressor|nr:BlaI/MecI/CopY family transcriptional regulator [Candidatus Latescibacterota bacterium]
MEKKRKYLTKTEWSIMKICWEKGQSSARVIYEETLKQKKRGYQSVKTMLDRLVVKGYLVREKFGPIWLYTPTVSHSKVMTREIDSFIDTVLDNTFSPLFARLIEKEKLSSDEIEALKKLIEEHEECE